MLEIQKSLEVKLPDGSKVLCTTVCTAVPLYSRSSGVLVPSYWAKVKGESVGLNSSMPRTNSLQNRDKYIYSVPFYLASTLRVILKNQH